MKVVVTVKQVPEPAAGHGLNDDYTLVRDADVTLDPGDEYGIEAGLRLRDAHGGEAVLVSMGRPTADGAIKRGLAMGADRGILVTDDRLRGADALLTARVLGAVIRTESPDLVICATESYDGSTGLVPSMLAEILDVPQLGYARSVEIDGRTVTIERQTDEGYHVVRASMPCLMTVTAGIGEPRYASLRGIMAARSREVRGIGLGALDVSVTEPVETVIAVTDVEQRPAGEIIHDDGACGVERILLALSAAKVV